MTDRGVDHYSLETFIRYNVEQGVIPQAVAPEDLFVPETLALV